MDGKSFPHKLVPGDTLQGLAVKYGVTVERLKKVNKIYTNDTIHVLETLMIPDTGHHVDNSDNVDNAVSSDISGETSTKFSKLISILDDDTGQDDIWDASKGNVDDSKDVISMTYLRKEKQEGETDNSAKEHNSANEHSACTKSIDTIFSKVDDLTKDLKKDDVKSEAFNNLNSIIAKIDNQIEDQKSKIPAATEEDGDMDFELGYQNVAYFKNYSKSGEVI